MRKKSFIAAILVVMLLAGFGAMVFAAGKTETAKASNLPKTVGYVVNYAMHEWYQNVMKGMKDRAAELGIELLIIDANLDMAKQVSAVEDLMAKKVDVLIITPVDQKGAEPVVRKAKAEGMPLVIEGNAVEGMTTLVSICDYDCGYKGGVETGKIFNAEIGGTARVLSLGAPFLRAGVLRVDGFMDGLKSVVKDVVFVHDIDGQGLKDKALQAATDALTADPNINVIYGVNNDSALGGLQAYRAAGLDEKKLLVCGTGSEGMAFINAMQEKGPYRVEAAMFPENMGYECMNMAVKLFQKQSVPQHFVTATAAMTQDTWSKYYTVTGNERKINWDAVNALPREDKCGKY